MEAATTITRAPTDHNANEILARQQMVTVRIA